MHSGGEGSPPFGPGAETAATAWISAGFETLCHDLAQAERARLDYDVIIVGSGYGGAIAASELAGCTVSDESGMPRPVSVCVLERGKEYLPGSFPSRFSELPGHVRISRPQTATPTGPREGLFDVRTGTDVSAVVANGLGGGSLINAGVMIEPARAAFNAAWPEAIREDSGLPGFYELARRKLGAADDTGPNTIERHRAGLPQKHQALRRLTKDTAGAAFSLADITVSMRRGANQAGVQLNECIRCGDCATGCNHGAKNSLDVNLLATASRRGAAMFTGATVLRIEKLKDFDGEAWSLDVVHTDEKLRKRQGAPLRLRARRVILAAGTFGSTEILLRSRSGDLQLSNMLGQRFSTNGDMIAAGYGHSQPVRAVADENTPPGGREIGPTITGMIRTGGKHGLLIQELAVPGPLRRIFEEAVTTSGALHGLARASRHGRDSSGADPHAVEPGMIEHTAGYAVMGNDGAQGTLELVEDNEYTGDGAIRIRWPGIRNSALFTGQIDALEKLAGKSGLNGHILPNPLWRLLPSGMEEILDVAKGPLLTVHPLGGCAMGSDCAAGVVDDRGRVYDRAMRTPFEGLVVLDGSIVPGALGVNPALTIAALSLRAVSKLRDQWGMCAGGPDAVPARPGESLVRPVFKPVQAPAEPTPTEIQILERMSGRVMMAGPDGMLHPRIVELTLRFSPIAVAGLTRPGGGRLSVDAAESTDAPASRVRIFEPDKWAVLAQGAAETPPEDIRWNDRGMPEKLRDGPVTEEMLDSEAEFIAPLSGTLDVFVREKSGYIAGTARTMWAWLHNRGLRDAWQGLADGAARLARRQPRPPDAGKKAGWWKLLRNSWRLASHARHARRLEYQLAVGAASRNTMPGLYGAALHEGALISGVKRLAYARRANPWRQLQEMTLHAFPGMQRGSGPVLRLDTRFLARQQWPLLRIVRQQDQPGALADLASLAAFVLRMMLTIHLWSFRKPDSLPDRKPERLPGIVPGLPPPEVQEIEVDRLENGKPVKVRITRYRGTDTALAPIVMIHGYSTSGTTFAHHAVDPNLAGYFWRKGRDVWILDMRTSSGMPTARHPWKFEDAAYADIPAAFNYIYNTVNDNPDAGERKLDVLAHCMGSAMLSMAILKAPEADERFAYEREQLIRRINKVVLSQVGPLVIFTPGNILRSYLMFYVRQLLPLVRYEFRPSSEPSVTDQLVDRLLATLPYPEEEFDLENPPWWQAFRRTPFTGIRHRMDALYGQDFRLANIASRTLRHMDDLFGPLNLETVSQVIHFARFQTITNRNGINEFVSRDNIAQRWNFPTLSVHGAENGLADIGTLDRMKQVFADAGRYVDTFAVPGYGHQDCLIGKDAERDVFERINEFLCEAGKTQAEQPQAKAKAEAAAVATPRFSVQVPWIGPIIAPSRDTPESIIVSATIHPVLGRPTHIAFVAAVRDGDRISIAARADADLPDKRVELQPLKPGDGQHEWRKTVVDRLRWRGIADHGVMLFVYPQSSRLDRTEHNKYLDLMRLFDAANAGAARGDEEERAVIVGEIENFFTATPSAELAKGLIMLRAARREAGPSTGSARAGLAFAMASCQYPAGMLDGEPAYASYRRLAKRLENPASAPQFLLLLGDQIYADATAGLIDPTAAADRYGRPYEELLHNPVVRSVFRRIPVRTMLDDHEIEDNWEPAGCDRAGYERMKEGRTAYLHFMRSTEPPPEPQSDGSPAPLWYTFTESGFPFFMLDTRTEREPRSAANIEDAHIMSSRQFAELTAWLDEHGRSDGPKFIVSPSILLPRLRRAHQHGHVAGAIRSDAWDGYPASLHAILAHIADHGIRNVVFLSGDEHLSCHARAAITRSDGRSVEIQSIHSSALYAPFPFANATPDDLAGNEIFRFSRLGMQDEAAVAETRHRYVCSVTTAFAPAGDGLAVIRALQGENGWEVSCEWDRGPSGLKTASEPACGPEQAEKKNAATADETAPVPLTSSAQP